MPRGDRKGPMGSGPMTGRGVGYCGGFAGPGFMSSGPGYGYGRGFGFGRGFGRGRGWRPRGFGRFWGNPFPQESPYEAFQPLTEKQEMDILAGQMKMLEDELDLLKKRQMELKKQKQKSDPQK